MTKQQIQATIGNRWACANLSATEHWNEYHTGGASNGSGSVLDYKKGPNDPVDPSATTANPTGHYVVVLMTGAKNSVYGTITYNYGAGGSYTYTVSPDSGTTATNPGMYSFCTAGGGINIDAVVSTGPGTC